MIQSVDDVRVNFLTRDQASKLAEELRARPVAELRADLIKERRELSDVMQLASRSGEDGDTIYDLSNIDAEGWKDKTPAQVREDLARGNDRINIMSAVVEEKTFLNDVSNAVNRAGLVAEGGRPVNVGAPMMAAPAMTPGVAEFLGNSETHRAALESVGGKLKGLKGREIEFEGEQGRQFMNAIFQRSGVSNSGWAPEVVRSGRFVMADTRPIQLIEMLPTVQASGGGYKWVQEGALSAENTSNRVPRERAEGAAVEEVTLTVTEKSVSIEKLGCLLPITEEQLADEPGARSYIEMRLPQQVRQRLDYQAINGGGTSPVMQGFAGVSGINTSAAASSSKIIDVILDGIEAIYEDTYGLPNVLVGKFDLWKKILNSKDTDGQRLFGEPGSAVFTQGSVWGIPFVLHQGIAAANTAYLMNTAEKLMVLGEGVSLEYGYVSDNFAKGIITVRCVVRANFADLRPTSTCSLTALNNAS